MPSTQSPSNVNLVTSLDPADVHHQNIQVMIPGTGAIPKIDVYFLADSSGSMTPVINAVKAGADDILGKLAQEAAAVGADVRYGVGNYRDFVPDESYCFAHQLSMTSDTNAVKAAITSWSVAGGGDTPEGQFYALDQIAQAPGQSVGWRGDAKRIIIWFGDAPGHDPICTAVSGLSYAVTEASVTQKLKGHGIFVLAISTTTGATGLDGDPVPTSGDFYPSKCGTVGGHAGQATRITAATGGTFADHINADQIVAKIIELGTAEITTIDNVKLEPDKKIAPFVRVTPPEGQGPLTSGHPHTLTFVLEFPHAKHSTTSAPAAQTAPITVNGKILVKIDGATTGEIAVKISVPDMTGTYKIQNARSGLHLQLENPAWGGDGANTAQNHYTGAAAEHWELIPVPGGGYRIKNADSARVRYLEVANASNDNGAEVLTRSSPAGQHKEWMLVPAGTSNNGNGTVFQIKNLKSGKAMEIRHQSTAPGARAAQQGYWGDWTSYQQDHHQHWYVQRV
ncbi:RICIN domain-containing protein [Streptomyces caelestis]|uniref:RICIN domain-containing protein n=1 Tax=Streptomyces caelestis TaxID=36816 RepID=UPI00365AAB9D